MFLDNWLPHRSNSMSTPKATVTEYTIPTPASGPYQICPSPDGRLWFAYSPANKIARIKPPRFHRFLSAQSAKSADKRIKAPARPRNSSS